MEATAATEAATQLLLLVAIVLAAGTLSGFIARLVRVPDIVLFLLVGVLLGPVLGVVNISADSTSNQLILIFGAAYILFDGGATLRFGVLKEIWLTVVILATLGVLITAALAGLTAWAALGLPLVVALLLGSVIASTDPATLIPIFKQVKIKERVSQTVLSESAFNDAMGAVITITVLGVVLGGHFSLGGSLLELFKEAGLGILVGAVLGYAAAFVVAHERYGFLREYLPLVTLLLVIGAYLAADTLGASGFMAVFVAGILFGNREMFGFKLEDNDRHRLEEFVDTTSLIMRMFIFILLGTQVNFGLLSHYLWGGLAVVAAFMFLARPATVFACTFLDRRAKWRLNERLFMCWTRETGVIPSALAGLLLGLNVPGARIISSVTFMAIFLTILLQATTAKWLAKRLGLLAEEPQESDPAKV